jgi:single-stranded-DNA-specific exonuclease
VLFRAKTGALAEAMLDPGRRPMHLAGYLRAEAWNGSVSASFIVQDAAYG